MKGIIKLAPINKEDIKKGNFAFWDKEIIKIGDIDGSDFYKFGNESGYDSISVSELEQIVVEYQEKRCKEKEFIDGWGTTYFYCKKCHKTQGEDYSCQYTIKQTPLQRSDWKKALQIGIGEEVEFEFESVKDGECLGGLRIISGDGEDGEEREQPLFMACEKCGTRNFYPEKEARIGCRMIRGFKNTAKIKALPKPVLYTEEEVKNMCRLANDLGMANIISLNKLMPPTAFKTWWEQNKKK